MSDTFDIGPLTAGDLIMTIAAVNNRPFDGSVVLAAKYRRLREEMERAGEGARLVVAPALDHTGFPDTTHMTAARQS